MDSLGRHFVNEIREKDITDTLDILNWYRNLYYKEADGTERNIMAWTIDRLFSEYGKELGIR